MSTEPPRPRDAIDFAPFQLDLKAGLLRRGPEVLNLRPKTFDVLRYLAERPGELVTKNALLDDLWSGVAVTEDVARVCVGELRAALGDQRGAPRFIETVPRRGYRFIAALGTAAAARSEPVEVAVEAPPTDDAIVGRARERKVVAEWLRAANGGRRHVAFISGEAGIGKTTLVEAAIQDLRRSPETSWRVARGQCVEHFGGGAPYLPVLEVLAELCGGPDGAEVRASLADKAPDWVPRALSPADPGASGTAMPASTHEHTLHKLAASLDAIATSRPLLVVLEDVQWSDYATLDLVSVLAQRRDPARLVVLCTLRPADAIAAGHPVANVKRELVRKGICREIALEGLPPADIATYLTGRLDGAEIPDDLLRLLVDRTEGNPFFVVTLVGDLLERGLLVRSAARWELRADTGALRTAIPEGLRAVIEPRLDRLTLNEVRLVEAASVVGPEFFAHAIAELAPDDSDLGDVELVEELCDGLVRRQEIFRTAGDGTWPDGTSSARFTFRHALIQHVAYRRINSSTRRRLHQAIGERLETAYAERTMDVASELAVHFERSRDHDRAVRYHGEAAAHAGSRFAYQETRIHLLGALALLESPPESPERLQAQLPLLQHLGWTLATIDGWGDPGAKHAFLRMRELAERLEIPAMRLRAMESIRGLACVNAEYPSCRTLSEETMALAEQLGDHVAKGTAHADLAAALIHLGEFESARDHAERGRELVDGSSIHGMAVRTVLTGVFAFGGRIAQANEMIDETLTGAQKSGLPYLVAFAGMYSGTSTVSLRDVERTRSLATEALRLASECGFSIARIKSSMLLGWCDVQAGRAEEGRAAVRAAFAEFAASNERTSSTTWQAILTEVHLACGDAASANEVLDAAFAFVAETGERIAEHELHRLRGECLLATAATRGEKASAAKHLERAAAIAAERKVPLFELRAATSLLRLRGKTARARVARLVEQFDGENDCADARTARALLGA